MSSSTLSRRKRNSGLGVAADPSVYVTMAMTVLSSAGTIARMTDLKIAVLFLHGIEIYDPEIVAVPKQLLSTAFEKYSGQPWQNGLVMDAALWGEEMSRRRADLFERCLGRGATDYSRRMTRLTTEVNAGSRLAIPELLARSTVPLPQMGHLRYPGLRWFLLNFVGDAVAYQKVGGDDKLYNLVHTEVANAIARLAGQAGPDAPLCVIGHSLGSLIASNYFYDLQKGSPAVPVGDTPLERGETLAFFYTLGSPIALWASSYLVDNRYGRPIIVPAKKFSDDSALGWVNLIDPDDVLAYPLYPLGGDYEKVEDRFVNAGPLLTSHTPLSHISYWYERSVMNGIAETLAEWHKTTMSARVSSTKAT